MFIQHADTVCKFQEYGHIKQDPFTFSFEKRKRKSFKRQFHTRRKIQHAYNTFIQHSYNTKFIQHGKYNLR